ncbi:hypothetical protein EXIGLDRAFT_320567 [Exidia glandulosa HHB12029]|uniref:Uncharacterized protein n=1 Tax=Exidia glandulosa HHB12029 TaxID=1314781 RepID=A0A165Q5D6_EXIGL|nr:hypothetical protein EXIGLDRAFT_320567 [Exidia glandulosa HHB12029]
MPPSVPPLATSAATSRFTPPSASVSQVHSAAHPLPLDRGSNREKKGDSVHSRSNSAVPLPPLEKKGGLLCSYFALHRGNPIVTATAAAWVCFSSKSCPNSGASEPLSWRITPYVPSTCYPPGTERMTLSLSVCALSAARSIKTMRLPANWISESGRWILSAVTHGNVGTLDRCERLDNFLHCLRPFHLLRHDAV